MTMKKTLREAAIGAATMALLLYAAITAARSMADTLRAPAVSACVAACPGRLQLAQNRD
jgi:hypothetical protein